MGIVDLVIIILVAAAVTAVSVYLVKQKKVGKSCCGSCAGCSKGCHTGSAPGDRTLKKK